MHYFKLLYKEYIYVFILFCNYLLTIIQMIKCIIAIHNI